MEIVRNYISPKGKDRGMDTSMSFNGDRAFFIARQIIETLQKGISDDTLREFDADELQYELKLIREKEYALDELMTSTEELNEIEEEKQKCIRSYQTSFLLYKYEITKIAIEKYHKMDSDSLKSILLRILMDHQSTMLAKYIQTLRFILHIIEGLPIDLNKKKDYYLNVSCLIGKQELLFLKCFKEFDKVTNIELI